MQSLGQNETIGKGSRGSYMLEFSTEDWQQAQRNEWPEFLVQKE
jgi:hypothetical protein